MPQICGIPKTDTFKRLVVFLLETCEATLRSHIKTKRLPCCESETEDCVFTSVLSDFGVDSCTCCTGNSLLSVFLVSVDVSPLTVSSVFDGFLMLYLTIKACPLHICPFILDNSDAASWDVANTAVAYLIKWKSPKCNNIKWRKWNGLSLNKKKIYIFFRLFLNIIQGTVFGFLIL